MSDEQSFVGPHGHDYAPLAACLRSLAQERLVYLPNPGNAGDALIALATYEIFDALNLDVEIGDHNKSYYGRTVLYGGGGSLICNYPEAATFIKRNYKICKTFVLLPSTVRAYPEIFSDMGRNCYIFARDKKTLYYLKTHRTNANLAFCHDLAFFTENASIKREKWKKEFLFSENRWRSWLKMAIKFSVLARTSDSTLSALRIDSEATDIARPKRNHDLSHYFSTRDMLAGRMDPSVCATTIKMMRFLMVQHKNIRTNRLHLAILGAISGLKVEMLPNSYDKNESIFECSIASFFPNVTFVHRDTDEVQLEIADT